ncbi:MAG TPA: hypothetical protein PL168_07715 [Methanobacterium sp.]|jgi:hypothetical protein|nr:hypothetical protein [Methanobacterium sp.]HOI40602.1 hypothetical protein [Methanobacterium sp.]
MGLLDSVAKKAMKEAAKQGKNKGKKKKKGNIIEETAKKEIKKRFKI